MGRAFHIPGIFFLFCTFVLLVLVSISLPYLPALDIVRTHVHRGTLSTNLSTIDVTQLRLGVWAYCWYEPSGERVCSTAALGYSPLLHSSGSSSSVVTIKSSWTRGLALHPVAAGVTLISLFFSLFTYSACILLASLTAFLACLLTLAAFAVDIALVAYLKHKLNQLDGVNQSTDAAPAFWMTLVSFILLLFAGCTVYLGRRRDRMAGATSYIMPPSKRSIVPPIRSWRDRFWKKSKSF